MNRRILQCYPFGEYPERPVEIVEGFTVYDGNLGDKIDTPHKGIDYVRRDGLGGFQGFPVYAAHHGRAVCGFEPSFGNFVLIRREISTMLFYETVYAHLEELPKKFEMPRITGVFRTFRWPGFGNFRAKFVEKGAFLGVAGTTGWTNGIPQLHFEMHEVGWAREKPARQKIDPYGVNDRFSSGRYPQPGKSLEGIPHCWESDFPPFA